MNSTHFFLKSFRVLLLPFALLYGGVVWVRNWLFDKGWLKSAQFGLPLICVGNLAVGGTGKSPMVEYLLQLLATRYRMATLSRGYKRKTKGYVLAGTDSTALDIGDEPMQFHQKFPDVAVAVGEERIVAIPHLLQDRPDTVVIVLDDAFQHRSVRAGLNILLTEHANPYYDDYFLPTGDLRDMRLSARRAQIIVVTKCPDTLSEAERQMMAQRINPLPGQQVFFTRIQYGQPYHLVTNRPRALDSRDEVLLVCGIANPAPLKAYVDAHCEQYHLMPFGDHHLFTEKDVREILGRLHQIPAEKRVLITTEKDATRLIKFAPLLAEEPVFVLPVQHAFLFGDQGQFDGLVLDFIQGFSPVEERA